MSSAIWPISLFILETLIRSPQCPPMLHQITKFQHTHNKCSSLVGQYIPLGAAIFSLPSHLVTFLLTLCLPVIHMSLVAHSFGNSRIVLTCSAVGASSFIMFNLAVTHCRFADISFIPYVSRIAILHQLSGSSNQPSLLNCGACATYKCWW